MTIDDESSVYVGGLPSATTEDTVRRVFDLYGAVVAVKIVCDRPASRGKCYGFVTFTNPRSALDAINDMNGRSIEGQIVRVSEVTTRGGKSKIGRERIRDIWLHKGRDQERKDEHYRGRFRDQNRDRPSEFTPQYKDRIRRGYEHVHDHDTSRQHFSNRIQEKVLDENEQGRHRSVDQDSEQRVELERIQDKDIGGGVLSKNVDEDKYHMSRKRTGATMNYKHTREVSSNSSDSDEVKEQLDRAIRRREEIKQEVSQMEVQLNEKQLFVSDLHKRSKKLEEALVTAKKLSSHRQKQLMKLYNCFSEVRAYTEKIKSSELELQSIVDAVQGESGMSNQL